MRQAIVPLPKACIFCGVRAKLTREDFFPVWFRQLYPRPEDFATRRINAEGSWNEVDPQTGKLITKIAKSRMAGSGDLADQTLRVVCASCNNGWMSRLQEAARPHLLPYIQGSWPRLSPRTRERISSWAAMFAMVTEFANPQRVAIPAIERKVFSHDLRPPIGSYIWVGRLAGDLPYWFHQRALRMAEDSLDVGPVTSQITTITLGHLLLQVYTSTSDLLAFDPKARAKEQGLVLIWPASAKPVRASDLPVRDAEQVRDLAYTHLTDAVLPGVATVSRPMDPF